MVSPYSQNGLDAKPNGLDAGVTDLVVVLSSLTLAHFTSTDLVVGPNGLSCGRAEIPLH
jgi:hypothetical protein